MAITISGENNNDKILATDGVIDQISGFSVVGVMTATSFTGDLTGNVTGNLTGNVNSTSPLLLQTGGYERFRITGNNELGIAGANYGSSGQVLTSGGSGSAVSWTTPAAQTTIVNYADNKLVTATASGTSLNAEANLTYDGTNLQLITDANNEGIKLNSTASGGSSYPVLEMDANRSAGNTLGKIISKWNGTEVASIQITSGADSTNKDDAHMYFNTASAGTAIERLRITSSGKVGINQTSPYADVDITSSVEDVNNGTLSNHGIRLSHVGATDEEVIPITAGFLNNQDRARAGIGFISKVSGSSEGYAGEIGFYTRSSADGNGLYRTDERLRIMSDGKIAINTDTVSDFIDILCGQDRENIVVVRGADRTTEYAAIGVSGGNAVITGGGVGSTNAGISFRTAASGTEDERARITSTGNVLVAHSTAAVTDAYAGNALEVGGSTYAKIALTSGTNTLRADWLWDDANVYFRTSTASNLFLGTDNTPRIKIANNSAATTIGGNLTFNAMLTVQGDLSGAIFQLKAAENTTRMMVSGLDTSDCEVNLYDKNGAQKGILVGGETEFALKAPNSSAPMTFYTHNGSSLSERARITSNGKTLIGNDTNNNAPRTRLEVLETHDSSGAGTFTPVLRLSTTGYGTEQGPQLQFGTTNSSYHTWTYGDICAGYEGGAYGGAIIFRTNSGSSATAVSERGRWTRDGHLKISDGNLVIGTSGHGIDFSATSNSSGTMTSELLDNYEEGTWTPTIYRSNNSGVSGNYNHQEGSYVRIGRLVYALFRVDIASFSGGSGHTAMGGLPFTTHNHGVGGWTYVANMSRMYLDGDYAGGVDATSLRFAGGINYGYIMNIDDDQWDYNNYSRILFEGYVTYQTS